MVFACLAKHDYSGINIIFTFKKEMKGIFMPCLRLKTRMCTYARNAVFVFSDFTNKLFVDSMNLLYIFFYRFIDLL